MSEDTPVPRYAEGGLIPGPGGEDTIPMFLHPGEHWYTAGQVRRIQVRARPPEEIRARLTGPASPLPPDLAQALADELDPEGP